MKKLLLLLTTILLIPLNATPSNAGAYSEECRNRMRSFQDLIEDKFKTSLYANRNNLTGNPPLEGARDWIDVQLGDLSDPRNHENGNKVMESPVFLKNAAKQIMDSCYPVIGRISFSLAGSDYRRDRKSVV